MGESAATLNPYIIYSILGFNALLTTVLLGAVLRLMFLVGRLEGEVRGIHVLIAGLQEQINGLRVEFTARIDRLQEQVSNIQGELRHLHRRIDLVMRHRHDADTGSVVLTPTEPSPEPVAD